MATSKLSKPSVQIGSNAQSANLNKNITSTTHQYIQIIVDDYMLYVSDGAIALYDRVNNQVIHKVNWTT